MLCPQNEFRLHPHTAAVVVFFPHLLTHLQQLLWLQCLHKTLNRFSVYMLRFIVVSLYVFFWCWFRFYLATELFVEFGNTHFYRRNGSNAGFHKYRACAARMCNIFNTLFCLSVFSFISFGLTRSNSFAYNRSVQKKNMTYELSQSMRWTILICLWTESVSETQALL